MAWLSWLNHFKQPELPVKNKKVMGQRSHLARQTQTLARFDGHIADALGVDRKDAAAITRVILGNIFRRVERHAAEDLEAQLPKKWRDELRQIPSGPDRAIKVATILNDLAQISGMRRFENPRKVVSDYFLALEDLVSQGAIDDLVSQLPKSFQRLVGYVPKGQIRTQMEKAFQYQRDHGAPI